MKRNIISLSILFPMLLLSCSPELELEDSPSADTLQEVPAQPGEAIVLFDEDMTARIESDLAAGEVETRSQELNDACAELGILSMERLFPYAGKFEERTRKEGLHRWYKVKFNPDYSVTRALGGLAAVPGIVEVEPVRPIRSTAVFNDPKLPFQWHYANDGSLDAMHKAGADINVVPVWQDYTTGSRDVIVAVVDGGVDGKHEDLAPNYIGGFNFVSNMTKVNPSAHGTHVAGTIAAVNNNGKGVSGIAGGDAKAGKKGVGILSCQIFEEIDGQSQSGNHSEAIKWGADHGAVISQNSWGYVYDSRDEAASATIPGSLKDAIDYFIKYAGTDEKGNQSGPMKGGVVIFAAGNDGWDTDPVGRYEPVISVGSIAPDFTRAYYSNYGDWVDIAAPGGSVKYASGQVVSTLPDNRYGDMQGTSMACPHVSGVAALVVSYCGGPGFTNEMLKERLLKGARKDVLSPAMKIGPLVDALGAVTYGGKVPPEQISEFDVAVSSNNVTFTMKVPSDSDDKKAFGVLVLASQDKSLLSGIDFRKIPEGVEHAVSMVGKLKAGEDISVALGNLAFEKDYYVAAVSFDYNHNYSALSPIKTLKTKANNAPEIRTEHTGDFLVKSHEILEVNYSVSDPDGHAVTLSCDPGSSALSMLEVTPGVYKLTIQGNGADPGPYHASIIVKDAYGMETSLGIDYELLENHAPVIVKEMKDVFFTSPAEKLTLDMDEYLEDPDGEQLKFSIKVSDPTVVHLNSKENRLYMTSLGYGAADVTVTAVDSRNEKCVLEFKVLVKDPGDAFDLYPNPVRDVLNVRVLEDVPGKVIFYNATGSKVYEEDVVFGVFDPAKIDMSFFAPGIYKVKVKTAEHSFEGTVSKI